MVKSGARNRSGAAAAAAQIQGAYLVGDGEAFQSKIGRFGI